MEIKLRQKNDALALRGLELTLSPALRQEIIGQGYEPTKGARPLERAFIRIALKPMAVEILKDVFKPGDVVLADWNDTQVSFTVSSRAKAEKETQCSGKGDGGNRSAQ